MVSANNYMWVIKYRKIFYAIALILVVGSFVSFGIWGLKPSIDFTGGTLIEVSYATGRPSQEAIVTALASIDSAASVRAAGTDGYIVRMKPISQEEKAAVFTALSPDAANKAIEKNFSSIGPVLGKEALRKSLMSILFALDAIVLFITFAFRNVS